MPFVKLDCGIVDSTIFCEPNDVFKAWITLLAKAGADGVARITAPALALLCRVTPERANEILDQFSKPEKHSRTQRDDGRRIQRVDGGYLVLNYAMYRDHDYGASIRMRKLRNSRKNKDVPERSRTFRGVTQAEAEADIEVDKNKRGKKRATALPPDFGLTPERVAYASQHDVQNVQNVMDAFREYHTANGSTMRNWDAAWRTWILREARYGKKPYQQNVSDNSRKSDTSILNLCKQAGISTIGKTRDEILLALQRHGSK